MAGIGLLLNQPLDRHFADFLRWSMDNGVLLNLGEYRPSTGETAPGPPR